MSIKITYFNGKDRQKTPTPLAQAAAREPASNGFDGASYVSGMNQQELTALVRDGANLSSASDRLAASQAAKQRLSVLSPTTPAATNGMAAGGGQVGGQSGGGQVGGQSGSQSGSSAYQSEIFQSVNPDTDTVLGQLQKHTDFSSPVMQRVAQQARDAAAGRGLSNSTIATGNAMGAVVDKAGEFATTDAQIYADRKTQNQQAATHLQATKMGNDTAIATANISADAQRDTARIQQQTTLTAQQMDNDNRLRLQSVTDAAAMARLNVDNSSKETIAQLQIEAQARDAELDRQSRERQTQISADNQYLITQLQQDAQDARQVSDQTNDIWRDYNQGVMNIDLNASAASQKEQLQRLNDVTRIRLETLGLIEEAAGLSGGTQSPPPGFTLGGVLS